MAKDNRFSGLQRKALENPYYIFEKKKQHAGASKRLDGYELYLVCKIAASGPSFWHLQIYSSKDRKQIEKMGKEVLANVGTGSICFEYMPKVVFYRQMLEAEIDEVDKIQRQIKTDVLSIFKYNDKLAKETKQELNNICNKILAKLAKIEGMDSFSPLLEELQSRIAGIITHYKLERSRIEAKLDKLD